MNRAVRSFLFGLGIVMGSVLAVLAFDGSTGETEETTVQAEPGRIQHWLEDFARTHAGPALQRAVTDARSTGRDLLSDDEEGLDGEALAARARERARRRAEVIAAAAGSEFVDPEWGPAREQQIVERFAAEAPPGFRLISTTCKTSLCIAEIETPSRNESARQSGWHRFLGFSRAYIHHRGEEGGAYRSVVYIAREGHTLPR